MDLSNLSSKDLRELQAKIQEELKSREKQDLEKARQQIYDIAKSVGMPVSELVGGSYARAEKIKKPTVKVPPQYRSPTDPSKEWSGRGRTPKFIQDVLDSGKTLESMRIEGTHGKK